MHMHAVPSGHILTKSEFQVLLHLLATYSNEKIKEIQQAIQKKNGRGISRQEVERSLRKVGMMTIADELEKNLQKGTPTSFSFIALKIFLACITLKTSARIRLSQKAFNDAAMYRDFLWRMVSLRKLCSYMHAVSCIRLWYTIIHKCLRGALLSELA